jgi:exonuclease SbcD
MVIFAGDAYKDRSPSPTFQREWDKRMIRLSQAKIPTIIIVGNHDLSPSISRAHALEELKTLQVPFIHVIDKPQLLTAEDLDGLPIQLMAVPWITRSGMLAFFGENISDGGDIHQEMEKRITNVITDWVENSDPDIPLLMTAHASVQGAKYGGERSVLLGNDLVLPGSLVKDDRIDYVALGHIHKNQDINQGQHPPVVYPGSIERMDFGEEKDDKFFVIANVSKGETKVEWHKLKGTRKFMTFDHTIETQEDVTGQIREVMQPAGKMKNAIVRLRISYPREWEALIDDNAIRDFANESFEFQLIKLPQIDPRSRLSEGSMDEGMSHFDLLEKYWQSANVEEDQINKLLNLSRSIITETSED